MKLFAGRCCRWGSSASAASSFPTSFSLYCCFCWASVAALHVSTDQSFQPGTVTVTGLGFRTETGVRAWPGLLALSCSPDRLSYWLFAHSSADYEVEQTAKCVNLRFGRSILIAVVAPQLPRPVYPVRRHWDWLWAGAAVSAAADADAFKWAILCASFKLFFLYLVLIVAAFAG